MKVDSNRIREERVKRAWSQEHLAEVTGLGVRTIQRIESRGGASHESIAAIAAVLAVPVDQLILAARAKPSLADVLLAKRLWILSPFALVAAAVAPPDLSTQLAVLFGLWIAFELLIAVLRGKKAAT